MKNKVLLVSASGLLLALSACACPKAAHVGEETKTTQLGDGVDVTTHDKRTLLSTGKIAGEETVLVTARATVQHVNKKDRMLTLRTPEGKTNVVKVGEEVRNFPQIKTGDEVMIDYYASVVFETREPTATEIALANEGPGGMAARAKLGEKPAAVAALNTVTIVTVDSIDKAMGTITVRDKAGKMTTIKARYPENLSYIAKGDKVVASVTEAVAAKVTPLKK